MASSLALVERALGPLDQLRLLAFRAAVKSRPLRTVVVRRDRRLALTVLIHAGAAFALAVYFPVLLFVLAPIALGVLHVASDVRYLLLRRQLPAWWRGVVVAACLILVGLPALSLLRLVRLPERLDLALVACWAVLGVLAGASKSNAWGRAGVGLALALGVGASALWFPREFRMVFLHAHNLVALAVWPLFYRARPRGMPLMLVPILAAALCLASGACYRLSLESPGVAQFGVHVLAVSTWLAPQVRADYAIGITSAFVFLQAIHYSIWLSVIPQGEMPGEGTLTFRRTARALVADFGPIGLVFVVVVALGFAGGALIDAPRASASYMSLAMFHGYLELVLLLYFWVARTPLRRPGDACRASLA